MMFLQQEAYNAEQKEELQRRDLEAASNISLPSTLLSSHETFEVSLQLFNYLVLPSTLPQISKKPGHRHYFVFLGTGTNAIQQGGNSLNTPQIFPTNSPLS